MLTALLTDSRNTAAPKSGKEELHEGMTNLNLI